MHNTVVFKVFGENNLLRIKEILKYRKSTTFYVQAICYQLQINQLAKCRMIQNFPDHKTINFNFPVEIK